MQLFYTDIFVLPLPDGHRFPMEKYSRLRESLLASGEFSASDFYLPHAATDEELGVDPREGPLSAECEGQALGALRCAVEEMLAAVAAGLERVAAITAQLESEGAGGEEVRNENGLDADWRASTEFCRVYVEGQRAILERSLEECRKLLRSL